MQSAKHSQISDHEESKVILEEQKRSSEVREQSFGELHDDKLKALTVDITVAKGNELMMDRLLKSVNMVKEVLQSNLKLREQIQELNKRVEMQNAEIFCLQSEREEQRDRLDILSKMESNVIPSKKPSPEEKLKLQQRMSITDEILQLRREKHILEQRVHYLELENASIRTHIYPSNRRQPGTDDFEPVRSILNDHGTLVPIKRNITGSRMKRPLRLLYEQDVSPKLSNVRAEAKPSTLHAAAVHASGPGTEDGFRRGASTANKVAEHVRNRNANAEKQRSKRRIVLPREVEVEDAGGERDGSRMGNRASWRKNATSKKVHSNA